MKVIRINFSGFWPGFDKYNNFFTSILKRKFEVEISENPDYLFYSVFSKEYLKYNCIRIFLQENVLHQVLIYVIMPLDLMI